MKTKPPLLLSILFTLLTFSMNSSSWGTVVTFDDLSETASGSFIANGYQGLNWNNFVAYNAILSPLIDPFLTNGSYYGMVSASNATVNAIGTPAEIDSGTNFNFLSAYLTGAWNSNLNIQVQGFNGATLLYSTTIVASATSPTFFAFNYENINRLSFSNSGGQPAFGTPSAPQFVMDNFTFELVPEPSSLLLTAGAALLLWPLLKRKRA